MVMVAQMEPSIVGACHSPLVTALLSRTGGFAVSPGWHHGDMCGRYAVTIDPALLAAEIDAVDETATSAVQSPTIPNYNVAPTDPVLAVVARHHQPGDVPTSQDSRYALGFGAQLGHGTSGRPTGVQGCSADQRQGGNPHHRRDLPRGGPVKRCLVPMDGWYEWRKQEGAKTAFI